MLNFEYCSPTKFLFGAGAEDRIGEMAAEYTKTGRVLLIYGSDRVRKTGLLGKIKESLSQRGIAAFELAGVQANPLISLVREGITLARHEQIDFIIPIGGGSVIDTGKGVACGVPYGGDVADFLCGRAEPSEALPIGVILTLSATGSEGSNCAVITDDEGRKAGMCNDWCRPKFAIMDPALTRTVPKWHTACGSCDILAHILEAYFTDTENVALTDELIEGLVRTVIQYAPVAVSEPENYNARAQLMWCGTLANSGFFAVGRMSDTTPHALGERMGANQTHGATLSVVIPAWMLYTYRSKLDRYVRFAEKVWNIPADPRDPEKTALAGIAATKAFFRSLGAPVTLQELGYDPRTAPAALASGDFSSWTQIPGFFFRLNEADRRNVYELATKE